MRSLCRLGMVVAMGAGALVFGAVLPAASALAATVPPGCNILDQTQDNAVSVKCNGIDYHGSHFRVLATSCSSSGICKNEFSASTAYPGTATASGPYPIKPSSVIVQWYDSVHTNDWCAFTEKGGPIAWCDMLASIYYWAAVGPHYCECAPDEPNWYGDTDYRRDCSGLVSMAWHLIHVPNTDELATSDYTSKIPAADLHPGDILDALHGHYSKHHVVIFEGWNDDHTPGTTNGTFRDWSFGTGIFGTDTAWHHNLYDSWTGDIGADHGWWYRDEHGSGDRVGYRSNHRA